MTETDLEKLEKLKAGNKDKVNMADFDFVALKQEISKDRHTGQIFEQSAKEKLLSKCKENPLVPIGAGVTALVLSIGIFGFATKRTKLSQTMMRARVAAQGFTLVALVGGVIAKAVSDQKARANSS